MVLAAISHKISNISKSKKMKIHHLLENHSDIFNINVTQTNNRTALEQAILEGGHTLEETAIRKTKYKTNIYSTLMDEKYKQGDYAKGKDTMPAAKKGRTRHPLHGKLVG